MKKNKLYTFGVLAVITLILAMPLVACNGGGGGKGGNDPKSLAKQAYELLMEQKKLIEDDTTDSAKLEALMKKSEELDAKVNALSPENRKIFDEEANHLAK
jgi:hypothetical protein